MFSNKVIINYIHITYTVKNTDAILLLSLNKLCPSYYICVTRLKRKRTLTKMEQHYCGTSDNALLFRFSCCEIDINKPMYAATAVHIYLPAIGF